MADDQAPAAHLSFIRTTLARPLTVFLPSVYRHVEQQHLEAFSREGALRLSCFSTFSQHSDEHRADKTEGRSLHFVNDIENKRTSLTASSSGRNCYILSVTSRTGREISDAFGAAFFEIYEPIGFCAEIANEIPGCTGAMIGQCQYVDSKILASNRTAPTLDDLHDDAEPEKTSLTKALQAHASFAGPKQLFLKSRIYEKQSEYRFIWETNKVIEAPLLIRAPSLRQFCRL
jgi:hypothetical protein